MSEELLVSFARWRIAFRLTAPQERQCGAPCNVMYGQV